MVSPKAKLRPAPAKQPPIGAPPPPAPDLELDPGAPGVGVHYPPRGWRIPRNLQGEVDITSVRPDIDDMVDDLASGWTEIVARRRCRDRIRAARHTAMRWHIWQLQQGIIPPGFILPPESAGGDDHGGPAAHPAADPNAPPLYRSRPPAKVKGPGSKGIPFHKSQTPAKTKGSGSKGRGKGGQPEGKGGRKGAHPGRGEYSRYAGYSEATSGAAPSAQFQESVPDGQAKGVPPEEPPSIIGGVDALGGTASAKGYMPTAISQLTPAEIEEERRIAEEFNAFLGSFLAPQPNPVAPNPAPTASAWKPQLPTRPPIGREAEILSAVHTEQGEAGAPAEAAEPNVDLAPSVGADGEPATVGSYPPYHKPAAVTVLGRNPPPPPPSVCSGGQARDGSGLRVARHRRGKRPRD